MVLPIRLISTDFDGTLHTELENPPVPLELQALIGGLQSRGVIWVINTGRDLAGLTTALARAQLAIHPDYLVTVEREIYRRTEEGYVGFREWNDQCAQAHQALFGHVRTLLPPVIEWIVSRFQASIFEDSYSPLCLVAANLSDADAIQAYLDCFAAAIPELIVVRNYVYFRLSHRAYNKGSALGEIAKGLGFAPEHVFAAGDDLNDLPMLSAACARWLVAPDNAIELVKQAVREQGGYVSQQPYGYGVARGLEYFLESTASFRSLLNTSGAENKGD